MHYPSNAKSTSKSYFIHPRLMHQCLHHCTQAPKVLVFRVSVLIKPANDAFKDHLVYRVQPQEIQLYFYFFINIYEPIYLFSLPHLVVTSFSNCDQIFLVSSAENTVSQKSTNKLTPPSVDVDTCNGG